MSDMPFTPTSDSDIITKPEVNLTVAQNLRHAAEIQESRNEEYGGIYKEFGALIKALFPEGITLDPDESDMNRFGCLITLLAKVQRYCTNFEKGGHPDSLTDIINYAAMLQELDEIERLKE